MSHALHSLAVVAAIAVASPRPVAADAKAEAQLHIDKARALFEADKPAAALDELKTAYALDPRPTLLYAIGQAHARLGQCADAKTFYERFLDTRPKADLATVARDAIAACKDKAPEPPKPTPEPPKPAPAPEAAPRPVAPLPVARPAPWYADYVGDALVGGGVVAGISGVLLYKSALGNLDSAALATTHQQASDLVGSAGDQRTYALVLGAGALGLVTAGVIHYVIREHASESVAIVPTMHGGLVMWRGEL